MSMRSLHLLRTLRVATTSSPHTISFAATASQTVRRVNPILSSCTFSTASTGIKVNTQLIKQLRESSGAPMIECRDALMGVLKDGKTDGSDGAVMQAAVEWLRKKGISTAAKKSGRAASEGLVSVSVAGDGKSAAMIELNSETDFAARNTLFKQLCAAITASANSVDNVTLESVQSARCVDPTGAASSNVATAVTNIVASLRENIQLRRATGVSVSQGVVGAYMHSAVALDGVTAPPSTKMGRQGALIGLQTAKELSADDRTSLQTLANKLAMQVVAAQPRFVSRSDVDPELIAKERAVLTEQANAAPVHVPGQVQKKASKPKDAKQVEKMVEGRINKWMSEIVLLDQPVMVAGDWDMAKPPTVGSLLSETGKKVGTEITVTGLARFLVGEGVATNKGGDFAKEVAEKLAKAEK